MLLNPKTVHVSAYKSVASFSVKAKVLTIGYEVLHHLTPTPSSLSDLISCPYSSHHATLTTPTSLVYLGQIRHIPTSGPLH